MGATPSLRASDDLPRQELLFVEQSLPDFLTFNFRDRLHVKNALPPWGYVVAWRVRQRETSGMPDSQVRFSLFLWDGLEASSQTKAVTSCHALELYEHISKGVHPRALVVWGEAGKPLDLTDTSEPALCSESDNAFLNYVCTVTGDARRTCDFYWSNENVRLFPYSSQLQGVHPSCSAAVDTPSSPPKTKLPVPLLKGLESLGRTSLGIGSLASARRPSYRGSATPTASESDSSVSGQYTFDGESESCSADAALQSPTPAVKVPFSLKLPKLPKLDADLSSPHSPSKRDSPVSLQGRASKRSCRSPVSLHVDSPAPRSARSAAFSQLGSLLLKYQDCVNAEQVMSREDLLEIYRPILSRIVPRLRLCSALMASSASANAVICPDVLVNLAADVVVPFFPHTRHLNLYLEDSRLCADKLEAVLYSLTVYLDSVVGATAEPPDRSSDPASLLTELYQSVSADSFGSPGGATVFCREGVSRSATVVIAYLMWRFKWQYRRALEFVRASREVVNPNLGFVMTLLRFEKSLKHPECVRYVAKAVTHHELSPFFTSVRELNFDS
ncbi:MAG: uncharacterized protein KVP18_000381 [Porospora cf. gigantea A]|uniref:uncharacterized protein n=1 Tax=Porospora cf. gigantea A TaxID=2853593 RepID=UPI0035597248|nr:MAG: hypothetical protein KVP18_000381 [Porospora cf. gigantea A]